MWIDIQYGTIKISDELMIRPYYSFDEFKNTRYYKGQDEVEIIDLEDPVVLEQTEFLIGIRFVKGHIYCVSLVQNDDSIPFENEIGRKNLHDSFLQRSGICKGEYVWGEIVSDYDRRGNTSSIDVYYKPEFDKRMID